MITLRTLVFGMAVAVVRTQAPTIEALELGDPAPIPDGAPAAMVQIERAGLAAHALHLASDELGGRHTGTAGQRAAADYIAQQFESFGLKPLGDEGDDGERSFLQNYPVARTYLDPESTSLTLRGEEFRSGFAVLPSAGVREVDIDGRLVYCGRGGRDDLPDEFAKGDIAVVVLKPRRMRRRVPSEIQFMMGFQEVGRVARIAARVARKGAEVVLVLDIGGRLADVMQYGGLLPGKPLLRYGDEVGMDQMMARARIPLITLGRSMSERVLASWNMKVDEEGRVAQTEPPPADAAKARVRARVRNEAKFQCQNVVAVLEGTDPDLRHEAVVFSAHMDHMGTRLDGDVFNGADDNASGSSGLLEIAQAFGAGAKPRRSVIFLSVSGEELGLWGSSHFSEYPTWPLADIVANVNIDMIGRATKLSGENEISVTPSYKHRAYSTIVRDAAKLARVFDIGLTVGDEFYERSDHYNFAEKGVPVVFFCDGEHEDYHQVTDHAEKLDYAKMERVSRLAFWTGWQVCQAGGRPENLDRADDWPR